MISESMYKSWCYSGRWYVSWLTEILLVLSALLPNENRSSKKTYLLLISQSVYNGSHIRGISLEPSQHTRNSVATLPIPCNTLMRTEGARMEVP